MVKGLAYTMALNSSIIELFLTVLSTLVASSGFWMYMERRNESKSLRNRLLLGLAHDRITYLGMQFIRKGWISKDEYENLNTYLYQPYLEMGGNGSAKRIMNEVDKLPIRDIAYSKVEEHESDDN